MGDGRVSAIYGRCGARPLRGEGDGAHSGIGASGTAPYGRGGARPLRGEGLWRDERIHGWRSARGTSPLSGWCVARRNIRTV